MSGAPGASALHRLRASLGHARFNPLEISGAFGDMGTFLPLLVAMVEINGLPLVSSLFIAGTFNVLTGALYAIPMAVQSMKAIAAAAVTQELGADEIVAAGVITSATVLLLGITRLLHVIDRLVPEAIVRGLQLGIGLALANKAIGWILDARGAGLVFIVALSVGLLLASLRWALPAALIIFGAGLVFVLVAQPGALGGLGLGLSWPQWAPPRLSAFFEALPLAAAQIPLTTLNSVIGVVLLARDLFPRGEARPAQVSLRSVATTVGLMNLIGCLFGAMPMCHGAGGLAGQYRFGARTGGSVIILGGAKICVAVLLGVPLVGLIHAYPRPLLGVLLLAAGVELAQMARRVEGRRAFQLALLTAAGTLGGGVLVGVLLGTSSFWLLDALGRFLGRRSSEDR